ncbi:hypothetical protein FNH22_13870 [Fulvivirga sp. M361]|uniref:DUF6607 family protein n=1 Tax=Fulvivirga sp. M361 TaxID=2594266 RepID=UPI00117A6511|nr:DUF6607 family protein [Fulvivirga sp. M361]TRX58428.1 hypothetical protein FNH22_13870 [Fulvivirga sp. M361]
MKRIVILMLCLAAFTSQAQKKKKQDIEAIKAMCGCYEVKFNFAETFATAKDYTFHDNYRSGALEYVFPVEETKDKIALQHLLVIGDTMIIKHWRQDWVYENTDLYVYDKDNSWKYKNLPKESVKGQWTQKVYQVDDGLRYEGSSSWVHVDGRHFWENTADAPLPRREFSQRDDYNVMVRRNRQEITGTGWVHEQDNGKVLRKGNTADHLLAREKGWNTYDKVEESKCRLAQNWWAEKQAYWADVRYVWDELFASKKTLTFKKKVDDKVLFMKLFALQDETLNGDYDTSTARKRIAETIQSYLTSKVTLAAR